MSNLHSSPPTVPVSTCGLYFRLQTSLSSLGSSVCSDPGGRTHSYLYNPRLLVVTSPSLIWFSLRTPGGSFIGLFSHSYVRFVEVLPFPDFFFNVRYDCKIPTIPYSPRRGPPLIFPPVRPYPCCPLSLLGLRSSRPKSSSFIDRFSGHVVSTVRSTQTPPLPYLSKRSCCDHSRLPVGVTRLLEFDLSVVCQYTPTIPPVGCPK